MEKNNEKTIDVLNTLVQINNDRIQGYLTASKETEESDLKKTFAELAHTSQKCKQELADEINKLGGNATHETNTSGKIYRAWMDIKAAITGKDRKAILSSCEFGEDVAKKTYEDVLKNNRDDLTAAQQEIITVQYNKLKAGHDQIKQMRDELVLH
jgi:uncharacterized protein (TIGR02284 family)